jgi:hypothetical protein
MKRNESHQIRPTSSKTGRSWALALTTIVSERQSWRDRPEEENKTGRRPNPRVRNSRTSPKVRTSPDLHPIPPEDLDILRIFRSKMDIPGVSEKKVRKAEKYKNQIRMEKIG